MNSKQHMQKKATRTKQVCVGGVAFQSSCDERTNREFHMVESEGRSNARQARTLQVIKAPEVLPKKLQNTLEDTA